jgi:hypothetical protein
MMKLAARRSLDGSDVFVKFVFCSKLVFDLQLPRWAGHGLLQRVLRDGDG